MRIKFEEVSVKGVRRWIDSSDGKRRQETRKFYQTISPFNKGPDGMPKTRQQIMEEVIAERDAWLTKADEATT